MEKMWKDISKLDVALFCFLGHRSNPNSMDLQSRKYRFSCFPDVCNPWEPLFVDLNTPSCFKKSKNKSQIMSENNIFEKLEFGDLKI